MLRSACFLTLSPKSLEISHSLDAQIVVAITVIKTIAAQVNGCNSWIVLRGT